MFKKDDKVRIKRWKEMMQVDGIQVDASGDLKEVGTGHSFTKDMRKFCSMSALVVSVDEHGIELYINDFGLVNNRFYEWMLETVCEENI